MREPALLLDEPMIFGTWQATLNGTGAKQTLRAFAGFATWNPHTLTGVTVEPGQANGSGVPIGLKLDQLQRAVLFAAANAAVAGSYEFSFRRGAKAATVVVPDGLSDVRFGDTAAAPIGELSYVDNWSDPSMLAHPTDGPPAMGDALQMQVAFTPDAVSSAVVWGFLVLCATDRAVGWGRGNALSGAQYR